MQESASAVAQEAVEATKSQDRPSGSMARSTDKPSSTVVASMPGEYPDTSDDKLFTWMVLVKGTGTGTAAAEHSLAASERDDHGGASEGNMPITRTHWLALNDISCVSPGQGPRGLEG